MSLFISAKEDAHYFSMDDVANGWSRVSEHGFELDGEYWPTVEHYYQAMKFDNASDKDAVKAAKTARQARKVGGGWFKKKRPDWKQVELTVMTRAVYIKMRTHPEIASLLLATQEQMLVEDSQFDYFWGCGRDKRGTNHYGQILMNVRDKLRLLKSES
ncbi:NADAR family protein [Gilvimarinus sp. SDUM040013]|uniref:NADAR family protein n=1 Tax=Gilvimarinus gilvus TaxID=3058038 RepID=A0ABU4RW29_9GAMM|nr:NADAR family protein [Gilvimarinus sp. SDUM040013]MDO3386491.1 NADAR family protein [Gilvimarinus sp. SDUM040013]MDX6849067.1 NADAR family protein [Gilvimarinus sp. SDUM040013]